MTLMYGCMMGMTEAYAYGYTFMYSHPKSRN